MWIVCQYLESCTSKENTRVLVRLYNNVRTRLSIAQLRWKCWDLPLDDFLLQLGIDMLQLIQSPWYERTRALLTVSLVIMSNNEPTYIVVTCQSLESWLNLRQRTNGLLLWTIWKWLWKMIFYQSFWSIRLTYHYTMVPIPENMFNNKTCRTKCTLCPKAKGKHWQTSYMCSTCSVPLCGCSYGMHVTTCLTCGMRQMTRCQKTKGVMTI